MQGLIRPERSVWVLEVENQMYVRPTIWELIAIWYRQFVHGEGEFTLTIQQES